MTREISKTKESRTNRPITEEVTFKEIATIATRKGINDPIAPNWYDRQDWAARATVAVDEAMEEKAIMEVAEAEAKARKGRENELAISAVKTGISRPTATRRRLFVNLCGITKSVNPSGSTRRRLKAMTRNPHA
jgi:hypothetical protein